MYIYVLLLFFIQNVEDRMNVQNVTRNLPCRMSHQIEVWYSAQQFRRGDILTYDILTPRRLCNTITCNTSNKNDTENILEKNTLHYFCC